MLVQLTHNLTARQQAVAFLAALFAAGALWLWHAGRRGLYARRGAWSAFGVEILQVGAILVPAYVGGPAPLAMAGLLTVLGAKEAWTTAARAWPHTAAAGPAAVLLVAFGFFSYAWLAMRPQGFMWVLAAYGVPEVHDVAAWLVGGAIGRTPMAPVLSPGKTWEGEVAGLLAGSLFAGALWWLLPAVRSIPVAWWVPGVLLPGIAGDLAGSYVKRLARQKDFARWVPTQGGALDLYDAWVFAAPVAAVYHWLRPGGA